MNVTRTDEFGWVLNGTLSSITHAKLLTHPVGLGNTWTPPADSTTPLLFQPGQIASLDPKVYFSYRNGSVVDIIFTVTAGNPALHPPHPVRFSQFNELALDRLMAVYRSISMA